MSKKSKMKNKKAPKTSGFFIASWFWVVGVIFFYLPYYYGSVPNYLEIIFSFLGWLSLTISIIGTFIELSKLIKNEGFSYWGASFVFIVPGIVLQYYISKIESLVLINIIKTIIVLFVLIGSGLFLYGISYFFKKDTILNRDDNVITTTERKEFKGKQVLQTSVSVLIALITLATAILQLTKEII